jgi:hypothetical protein
MADHVPHFQKDDEPGLESHFDVLREAMKVEEPALAVDAIEG